MPYNKIFSIPVSQKCQMSMRRRFIVFSSVLYLLIFAAGSAVFIILMSQILRINAEHELIHIVEMERFELEACINSEIAIAVNMADSPLIRRYFLNPADSELEKIAFEEIAAYRKAFSGNTVFWVNDADKRFYFNDSYAYTVNTADPNNYWYLMTLYGKGTFVNGGVVGDAIRNIRGNLSVITYSGLGGYDAFYLAGTNFNNNMLQGSAFGQGDFYFDASRVVPAAADNRVRTLSSRLWRRVA